MRNSGRCCLRPSDCATVTAFEFEVMKSTITFCPERSSSSYPSSAVQRSLLSPQTGPICWNFDPCRASAKPQMRPFLRAAIAHSGHPRSHASRTARRRAPKIGASNASSSSRSPALSFATENSAILSIRFSRPRLPSVRCCTHRESRASRKRACPSAWRRASLFRHRNPSGTECSV